jgi:hypothetical protein
LGTSFLLFFEIVFQEQKNTFISVNHFVEQNISTFREITKNSKILKEKKKKTSLRYCIKKQHEYFPKFSGNFFSFFYFGRKQTKASRNFVSQEIFFLSQRT